MFQLFSKRSKPVQPYSATKHAAFLNSLLLENSLPHGDHCTIVTNRVSFVDKSQPDRTFTSIVFEGTRPDIIELISVKKGAAHVDQS